MTPDVVLAWCRAVFAVAGTALFGTLVGLLLIVVCSGAYRFIVDMWRGDEFDRGDDKHE